MPTPPRVSVLIVSYNTRDLLVEAIASVVDEPRVEVIVVDNASRDGSADAVMDAFPQVKVVPLHRNVGFAAGVNRAAAEARAPHLLVLNPDARLERGCLDLLLQLLETHPRAALVGPSLRYPNGSPQAAAFTFPGLAQLTLDLFPVSRLMGSRINGRIAGRAPNQIDHPLGACMLIRRAAWHDVGSLDEGYFMYLEEIDWCRRARRRGWEIWTEPRAIAVHHAGSSTRQHADLMYAQLWRSRLRYYQRFSGPAYNRLVHALVQFGLSRGGTRRTRAVEAVRRLAS